MLLFFISLGAGFAGALLGLGGGMFIIPAVTLGLGVGMHQAIGASIVAVIATSSASAASYVRENLANIRVATFLELATTSGALLGALLASQAPGRLLSFLFGLLLLYSAYGMFRSRNAELPEGISPHPVASRLRMHASYFDRSLDREVPYQVAGATRGFLVMLGAGLVSGLLGVGSGMLKVLGMDQAMKLPMKVSTATSNFMMGVTAAVSAGYYFTRGYIDPALAGPVILGVSLGAHLGSRVMCHLKSSTIRKVFLPLLLLTSLQMLWRGIHP